MIGDPYKALATLAGLSAHRKDRYFTYGEPLLPNRHKGRTRPGFLAGAATSGFPLGPEALEQLDLGNFDKRELEQTMLMKFLGVDLR